MWRVWGALKIAGIGLVILVLVLLSLGLLIWAATDFFSSDPKPVQVWQIALLAFGVLVVTDRLSKQIAKAEERIHRRLAAIEERLGDSTSQYEYDDLS